MSARYTIAGALVAGLALTWPARAEEIDLGGPRKVRVSVRLVGERYVVTARLLPVKAFDEATNAALNRQKAEQYALTGLGRHLAKEKKAEFLVKGARVTRTGSAGKFFTLTLEVPARGVRLVKSGEGPPAGRGVVHVKDLFESRFFTLKRDLIDTARGLASSLAAGLAEAEKLARDEKSRAAALVRIAELEERGDEGFKSLRSALEKDRLLLLSDEVEEVQAEVGRLEKAWHNRLTQAARRIEEQAEKKRR